MADQAVLSRVRRCGVTMARWGVPDRDEDGQPKCRWCQVPIKPPRRTFCSDACVHEWRLRSDPSYVREQVARRDRGICQHCGVKVLAEERRWRRKRPPAWKRGASRAWRKARPRWEADHIVPVADGGGYCGLENYRLLCRTCHLIVTNQWRKTRLPTKTTTREPLTPTRPEQPQPATRRHSPSAGE